MSRFEIVPASWMSSDIDVLREGQPFARLSFGGWKTVGRISVEGEQYEIVRESVFSNVLRLQRGASELTETSIHGFCNQEAEMAFDGVGYTVSWHAMGGVALLREGVEVGSLGRNDAFRGASKAEFADDLPAPLCAFALWLAAYKRNNDASSVAMLATTG